MEYTKQAPLLHQIFISTQFIGGNNVQPAGAINTYAFYRGNTIATNVIDNIFMNARSNNTGTGTHYAIYISAVTGYTGGYNLMYTPGTGGKIGLMNATACTDLRTWRYNVPSQDLTSASADPNFTHPTDNSSTVSLDVQSNTPTEGFGLAVSGIDYDIEAHTRSSLTPTDIGANAGNYTASTDIYTPVITYNTLGTQIAACGSLTFVATITDQGQGIYLTGAQQPRFYIRRTTGGSTSWFPITGTYTGSANNSIWTFVVNYSTDMGITVATGDVFQFFIVAKDQAGNLWSSKFDAATYPSFNDENDLSSLNTAPTTPDSYTISTGSPLSGIVTVGASGADYTSFSATGGLFSAINTNGLSGDLTVYVTSSVSSETGAVALNQWTEYCGSGYVIMFIFILLITTARESFQLLQAFQKLL